MKQDIDTHAAEAYMAAYETNRQGVVRILLLRSGLYTFFSGCIALAIFAVVDQVRMVMIHPGLQFNLTIISILFFLGGALAVIPMSFGAITLAFLIYRDACKDQVSIRRSIFKGSFVGMIIVLAISVIVSGLILNTGKGSIIRLIELTIEATILGTLAGGWSGFRLSKYYFSRFSKVRLG